MPALSPTMTEGTLARWLKKEGDKITPGQVIAEIETDKAIMEIENIESGTIGKILVQEGAMGVKVNQVIAILLEAGEDKNALEIALNNIKFPPLHEESSTKPVTSQDITPPVSSQSPTYGSSMPMEQQIERQDQGRIFISPLAKRLANEKGIDISRIKGSGPHGRIVKIDIKNAFNTTNILSSIKNNFEMANNFERQADKITPMSGVRKTIGTRLLESKQNIPHFYLTIEMLVDKLMDLRNSINLPHPIKTNDEKIDNITKISVNDLIIKAVAKTLESVPEMNVMLSEDKTNIVNFGNIDISVAIALKDGLVTPIVKDANKKSLQAISLEMKELIQKAKENRLRAAEFIGGSFTISNLGMFGINNFYGIINTPQAAIMSVGGIILKPIVLNDKIIPGNVMEIGISCDHRVIDGAIAAKFLQVFKYYIENPVLLIN